MAASEAADQGLLGSVHGPLPPLELTSEHLRSYQVSLSRKTKLSRQSIRHVLSDCRCMLRWCEEAGLIGTAPVPRRWLPKVQERPPDRLSDDEVERVLAIPEPYAFVCRFGLGTGLRWSELVRASASDVNAGVLTVHQTKSGKIRRIPLPANLKTELKGRIGRFLSITDPGGFAIQVPKHSGVDRFHAHQLRHTFACRWLEAGGSLAALQELLGHTSIVTTQRYARLAEDHVRAEMDRIGGQGVAIGVAAHLRGMA